MGWFTSLTNGLGSAVNWVSQNSGTIAGVAGTVAKVAGLLLTTEDEREVMNIVGQDDVADLQLNYNKANRYLEDLAKSSAPTSALELGTDPHTRESGVTQAETLSGVWTQPSDLDDNGNPLVDIVQDITKFLHQHNMPTTLKIGGVKQEIAKFIGQAVFGNAKNKEVETLDGTVHNPTFSFHNDDKSCYITGCMGYYNMPLSQANSHSQDIKGLHSALHVKSSTTRAFRVAHAIERRNMCFSRDVVRNTAGGGSGWLVTLQVAWTAGLIAQQAFPKIQINLNNSQFTIVNNQQQGNLEIIKVQALQGGSPYQIKNAVTAAIAAALKSLTTPQMYMNDSPVSTTATQLPVIEITNSTFMDAPATLSRENHNDKVANIAQSAQHFAPSRSQIVIQESRREVANQTPLAVRNDYRGSSDGGDWTEVGAHVNGDMKQMDMSINKRGVNRADWR